MLAAVQPVRFHVMAAGSKRTFTTTWVGLVDVRSGEISRDQPRSAEIRRDQVRWVGLVDVASGKSAMQCAYPHLLSLDSAAV